MADISFTSSSVSNSSSSSMPVINIESFSSSSSSSSSSGSIPSIISQLIPMPSSHSASSLSSAVSIPNSAQQIPNVGDSNEDGSDEGHVLMDSFSLHQQEILVRIARQYAEPGLMGILYRIIQAVKSFFCCGVPDKETAVMMLENQLIQLGEGSPKLKELNEKMEKARGYTQNNAIQIFANEVANGIFVAFVSMHTPGLLEVSKQSLFESTAHVASDFISYYVSNYYDNTQIEGELELDPLEMSHLP